jgi:hypothetical protein
MSGKTDVEEMIKSGKGKVYEKDGERISAVSDRRRKEIIFHNTTSGGIEFLSKREAAKRIDALTSA